MPYEFVGKPVRFEFQPLPSYEDMLAENTCPSFSLIRIGRESDDDDNIVYYSDHSD